MEFERKGLVAMDKVFDVFLVFLRLGLTSFGGPLAHLGYFHNEFVKKRKWLSETSYGELVALCQLLPGPASSQVGMAIGLSRAGIAGAVAAWLAFTMPSAIALVLFALGLTYFEMDHGPFLHGLKVVAVAIVAHAIWGMGKSLCPDRKRMTIAVLAAALTFQVQGALAQVAVIAAGGIIGILALREDAHWPHQPALCGVSRRGGLVSLICFTAILIALPALVQFSNEPLVHLVHGFFRAGALVFGGGHVVLPLLQAEVVQTGWVSNELFMAGYGAAQAIPGPLFTFAAFLGAVAEISPSPLLGAMVALVAVFLPSFLLIIGVLPFWEQLKQGRYVLFAMQGINSAVVGLLLAAFYNPVWTSAIYDGRDFSLAAFAFLLLAFWKWPSWAVVVIAGAGAWLFQ